MNWGCSGVMLRSTGVKWDLRKSQVHTHTTLLPLLLSSSTLLPRWRKCKGVLSTLVPLLTNTAVLYSEY